MKCIKILALLVLASVVSMVAASTASATRITSPTGTLYTGTFHAQHEGTHVHLHTPLATIECSSTLELSVTNHGVGITATGDFTNLTFSPCTNNWHVTVTSLGTFQIHGTTEYGGTLTSSGLTITATRFGVTCLYETNNTNLGKMTGGNPGRVDIAGSIPVGAGSSALCGSGSAGWTGTYVMTGPVYIDPDF